ncbi:TPA: TIGR03761 family integrating conjugative element protein [Klebsiella variicola]|nr:TIGR03761 family integrating conjugative element protein [Klebsiella variicola]HED4009026.1 TIGR03761 family integrating conjugative element protein [Klebsiella variicola subsp. variicola]
MSDGKTKGGTTASRAGALQSSVNILLHTHYAIRLWEGRKRDASNEIGAKKKRPEIISMPQAIARSGNASRDSAADNPYADMVLLRLEEALLRATLKINENVSSLDAILSAVPKGVMLSEVESANPLNISVFSRSPLGYRCVWLLVGYDQLAMKAFQAHHYGLISRAQRDAILDNGGHAVRQVYGVIQPYRTLSVTRRDITEKTPNGLAAIERNGEPDPDVFSGKRRSSFSSPIKNTLEDEGKK